MTYRNVQSIFQVMQSPAPQLLPLLRSALQGEVLALILLNPEQEWSLTELANRRALIARLEQETERSRRYSTPMAIAMVDLDNFKLVNDTYGHDVGDQVLRRTANAIRSSVRSVDLAARYGGEEFTVLFPHLTLEQAVGAMERCRAAIADDTAEPRLTVSVGVAASPPAPADLDVLLSLADQALYAAKQSGKNRVVAAPSALDIKGEHAA